MKKVLSLLMCFIMVLSCLSISVSATEQNHLTHDEMITLACGVFPEYVNMIKNTPESISSTYSVASSNPAIVRNITREVSENSMLNYTEYSDGVVVLSEYTYSGSKQLVGHTATTGGYISTVNITVTCTIGDGIFYLNNVEYKTLESDYDSIVYAGSPSSNSYCKYTAQTNKLNETSSSNAYVKYNVSFIAKGQTNWGYSVAAIMTFTVGDNTAWLTVG